MATYIQGVTDYIPKIQPFTPDFNFYSTALQTLQSKYDTNYKQLSEYYGRLLRSPMLRDDDIERRKKFEEAIMGDIQKISGMDLSLQQNVDQAMKILDPLVNDKSIINDIVKTRQWNDAKSTGENLKNTEYGWEGGMRALDYWAQDFRSVNYQDALNFSKPEYTPYVNLYQMAIDDAKEQKWEVKQDNISKDGKWIVTNKNGDLIAPTLRDYMIGRFGRDPQVMKFLNTEAYIERKDYISANKDRFNGNEAEAQMEYAKSKLDSAISAIKESKVDAKQKQEMIDNYYDLYEDYIRKNGILPADSKTINQGKSLQQAKQNTAATSAVTTQQANTLDIYMKDYQEFLNNGQKLDQIISYNNMYKTLDAASKGYAHLTAEFSIKGENPYMLEQIRHANNLALEAVKNKNKLAEIEAENKKKEEQKREEKNINSSTNLFKIEEMPGASTKSLTSGVNENIKQYNTFVANSDNVKSAYLADVATDLKNKYNSPGVTAAQKKGIESTIQMIFGNKVSATELLNPVTSQTQIDRIRKMTSNSEVGKLTSYYNDAKLLMETAGNPLNEYANTYTGRMNEISNMDKGMQTFVGQRLEQNKEIIKWFGAWDKTTGSMPNDETGIVSGILSYSSNGFFPSYNNAENIAKKIESASDKKWGKGNHGYTYDYVMSNWNRAKDIYYKNVSNIPNIKAWNQSDILPFRTSSGKVTGGVGGNFDFSDPSESSNTAVVKDIFTDIQKGFAMIGANSENAEMGAGVILVDYGDGAKEVKVSNPQALAELKAMILDSQKVQTGKLNKITGEYEEGDDVVGGAFTYANIAGYDDNYIQFNITPGAKYAGTTQKYKDEPGYISGQQITVRIPKSIAQNVLYKQSQTTLNEYLYENSGTVSANTQSASYSIINTSTGPKVTYQFKEWDPNTGSFSDNTGEEYFTPDYDVNDIYDQFQNQFEQLDAYNMQAKMIAAQNLGLTGDQAVSFINSIK